MTGKIRKVVRERACERCEYCRIRQIDVPFFKHQIEHIIARQHGGNDRLENLALACYRCNKYKGPNLSAIDPRTGKLVRLFNPRRQKWTEHFSVKGVLILGRTSIGRATAELLNMNAPKRQSLRRELGSS